MNYYNAIITKSVGGIYSVETSEGVFDAKPRGIFRKNSFKPCVGDIVTLSVDQNSEPVITAVNERKNELIRPPLANIDLVLLVISTCEPLPNAYIIDKLLAIFKSKGIETALVFTKTDLEKFELFAELYRNIEYKIFSVSKEDTSIIQIREYVEGKVTALIGNSGVGKSTLLNKLLSADSIKTGEISKKLGRGRHTTREVSFFKLENKTYIADTPGFSTVDISKYVDISSADIKYCFDEFQNYSQSCRFKDCLHQKEAGCKVTEAVKSNLIPLSRYQSYCRLYEEAVKKENEY